MSRAPGYINPRVAATAAGNAAQDLIPTLIDQLADVDTSTTPPVDGQGLIWDQAAGLWIPGAAAVAGELLHGAVAPDASIGVDGDFYIDDVAWEIYGPKAAGAWPAGVSIVGPAGAAGAAGAAGPAGPAGPTGSIDILTDVDTTTTAPTDGQVLKYHAATGQWLPAAEATGSGGGLATLLDTQVAAGASSIVWDNTKITATYKTYEIRYEGVTPSVADVFIIQLSTDNGATWRATGYITQRSIWGLTTNFSNYALNGTTTGFPLIPDSNVDAARPMSGEAMFYNLMSASKIDMMQGRCMGKMSDSNIYDCKMGGVYNTGAEAHNAIRIVAKGGVATFSGTFKLYGIT